MFLTARQETGLSVKNPAGLLDAFCLDSEQGEAELPKEHSEM